MKLNREQIVKALEICSSYDDQCAYCCPYAFNGCARELAKDALALIRDLDSEKEMAKADTLSDIQTRFAMHFGTYTREDTIKVSDVFKLLERFKEEIMEG